MALQVWLPLNGNSKNQGIDPVNFTEDGVTYSDGKTGKCASGTVYGTSSKLSSSTGFSFSLWWKISNDTNCQIKIPIHNGEKITYLTLFKIDYDGCCALKLATSSNEPQMLWVYDKRYSGNGAWNLDEWTHFAITIDTSNGCTIATSYVNGVRVNWATTYDYILNLYPGEISCYGGYYSDVRIYDHVLSPLEIKEISKGLMLHYKLSGIGGENLLKDTLGDYSSSTYMFAQYYPATPLTPGETYTATICVTPALDVDHYGLYFSCGYVGGSVMPLKGSGRQIVKKTFTMPSYYPGMTPNDDIAYSAAQFYRFPNNGSSSMESTIHWAKIEKGSVATPWCPNPADALYSTLGFDNGIEYDCSGFGHNGTKVGTMTWSNDTRRYTGSYMPIDDSTYIKSPTLSTAGCANSYTISYWGKIDDMNGRMAFGFANGNMLNLYPAGYFCWNTGDGGSNQFKDSSGNSILLTPYNEAWHHYTITGDGATSTLYIDGEKAGIATKYRPITGTHFYISGWSSSTDYKWTNGNLSDFRLYATCLSASDVKALHEVSASVGDNGAFFAHEIVEE